MYKYNFQVDLFSFEDLDPNFNQTKKALFFIQVETILLFPFMLVYFIFIFLHPPSKIFTYCFNLIKKIMLNQIIRMFFNQIIFMNFSENSKKK